MGEGLVSCPSLQQRVCQDSWFSLYALPNPDSYNQNPLDTSALVPVLAGMDFLGKDSVGMMIDFHTGLAMNTKNASPQIFQLTRNHKGHFILDIVQHLTKGHTRHEGQAHVLVRSTPTTSSEPIQNQVLEQGTVCGLTCQPVTESQPAKTWMLLVIGCGNC